MPIKSSSSSSSSTIWHHNRYNAEAACKHCGGVVHHECWCLTHNPNVRYAYEVVLGHSALTLHDQLILHSLGVTWTSRACECRGAEA